MINPIALRMAKTPQSFGNYEYSRVNPQSFGHSVCNRVNPHPQSFGHSECNRVIPHPQSFGHSECNRVNPHPQSFGHSDCHRVNHGCLLHRVLAILQAIELIKMHSTKWHCFWINPHIWNSVCCEQTIKGCTVFVYNRQLRDVHYRFLSDRHNFRDGIFLLGFRSEMNMNHVCLNWWKVTGIITLYLQTE